MYPTPGSSTITLSTTPLPLTNLGQGGGIKIADTPIGFSVHGLVRPVLTVTFLLISTEVTTGLVLNVLSAFPGML